MAMLAEPIVQRIRQENEELRESGELHRQRIRALREARRTDRQKSEALKERLADHWTVTSRFLDDIIKYPEFLHAMTLRTPEKFDHTLNRLKELLERSGALLGNWEQIKKLRKQAHPAPEARVPAVAVSVKAEHTAGSPCHDAWR